MKFEPSNMYAMCDVVENSPFKDKNGTTVFLLTTNTVRGFWSYIYPQYPSGVRINICNFGDFIKAMTDESNGFCAYADENLAFGFRINIGLHRRATVYLLTKNDAPELDVESAFHNIEEYIKNNPRDKYVVASLLKASIINNSNHVYDFMNHYDYDSLPEEEKTSVKKPTIKYEVQSEPKTIYVQREVFTLDKAEEIVDNITTLDDCIKLAKLIDKSTKFLYEKGFDLKRLLKYSITKESYIDDECGYPIVKDVEDIPSPFPEDIEGDLKMSHI